MSRSGRPRLVRGSANMAPATQRALRDFAEERHRWRVDREELAAKCAKRSIQRDETPERASATAFANWVFWQRNPNYQPPARGPSPTLLRWSGEYGHKQICTLQEMMSRDRRVGALVRARGDWRPIYVDGLDRSNQRTFFASRLRVDGQKLSGRPDVVLRDASSGNVIILERKVVHRPTWNMPKDGFANHWCQVWTYGWMDAWVNAPNILLVLQYWRRDWKARPQSVVHGIAPVRMCRSPAFDAWARNWFHAYGGRFVNPLE